MKYIYGVMNKKEGYNNKLYYPRTSGNYDIGNNGTSGYRLASPSAYYDNGVLSVRCDGYVGISSAISTIFGLRPVVSLNSGITVNAEEVE